MAQELKQGLCINLEGWDGEEDGREVQGGGDICIPMAFTFHFHALEKEMATHSSVLAWRIPASGEPGGLPSMESDTTEAT